MKRSGDRRTGLAASAPARDDLVDFAVVPFEERLAG
jgi:hypothetical protein